MPTTTGASRSCPVEGASPDMLLVARALTDPQGTPEEATTQDMLEVGVEIILEVGWKVTLQSLDSGLEDGSSELDSQGDQAWIMDKLQK
jgi:hypothetical protein